jgi:hypothetical protein
MHTLRAALAASGLVLAGSALRLPAQDTWNDARTLELVRAATARRAVQLADTGLRSYTARATGTLTFLAQLGEGFLQSPALVKSDQLVLEVYWGAPDRSKQRIVGRRDTLLLPTDINYHRDHLGIIQNNFPSVIRLGDGDEVLDVPHPLSEAGPRTYDYRLADSLAIRGSGVSVDVMMISVRPKDPSVPAAVGAVYVDRASASVVRMTFSFTRAALRDRQLEDVSVILENGLVEGRFWLPRRQEIEVRRSASWMDFPARGIIRGRWEICCIQANIDLAPQAFFGEEIIEAGTPEQLRAYPFEGGVLEAVPEDVRALDAEEVRAVQEEARRLVQASALARTRSSNLAARGISDFVRSDRVEGLALGAGFSQRMGAGFALGAGGRYGFADSRWKARGSLSWRRANGVSVALEGTDDWLQLGEVPEVSGVRNSLAAQEFGSDWTNPIGARGGVLRVERARTSSGRTFAELALRTERALQVNASSASGSFGPTVPAAAIDRRQVTLGWERTRLLSEGAGQVRGALQLRGSEIRPPGESALEARVARASGELELLLPLPAGRLRARTVAAATSAGSGVPLQDAVRFGGPVTGPGYGFHALVGGAGVSQRLEWQGRMPFVPINLGRFGRVPATLVFAPYLHGVWIDRPLTGVEGGWHPAVGIGAIGFFDLLRVDVARGLRDGRWVFSLDVARELWPVL